jgi:fructokinase
MNAKLGGKTAFIEKVGEDDFGFFLKKTLQDAGIDVSGLSMTKEANTSLAFVHLNEKGDRSFTFYRKLGADTCLKIEDVKESLLHSRRIFHFGSVSLTDEPCRSATLEAAKKAKKAGAVISYDPNYRALLWNSETQAKEQMLEALPLADVVKVSEEEMNLLTGETDLAAGAGKLAQYGISLVLITLGPKGAFWFTDRTSGTLPAYDVKTVDTTGAGDAFLGAFLYCIRNKSPEDIRTLSDIELKRMTAFANGAGSLTTLKKGAIPAMPTLARIEECVKNLPFIPSS